MMTSSKRWRMDRRMKYVKPMENSSGQRRDRPLR
jgi:hypothetical protein